MEDTEGDLSHESIVEFKNSSKRLNVKKYYRMIYVCETLWLCGAVPIEQVLCWRLVA